MHTEGRAPPSTLTLAAPIYRSSFFISVIRDRPRESVAAPSVRGRGLRAPRTPRAARTKRPPRSPERRLAHPRKGPAGVGRLDLRPRVPRVVKVPAHQARVAGGDGRREARPLALPRAVLVGVDELLEGRRAERGRHPVDAQALRTVGAHEPVDAEL